MWLRTSLKALGTVGAFFGVFLGYLAVRLHESEKVYLARPTVTGRMLAISVGTGPGGGRSTSRSAQAYWQVKPRYAYEVEGQPYIGERLSNAPRLESAHVNDEPSQELKQYLARYPVGSPVQVHYNPRSPEDSLLEVEVGGAAGFTLASTVAFVSAVLGWGGLLVLFLSSRRRAAVSGSHGG
ncbi:DUF3592 domain-containing protein [Corallococcus terminator]|nr:DUF3592 domain-containing protein [Corallococcus terminator]